MPRSIKQNQASDSGEDVMEADPYAREREEMVEYQIRGRGIRDPRVLAAMRKIPRHLFVPKGFERSAYEDRPLPSGGEQSQPYIVALMTEQPELAPGDRCRDRDRQRLPGRTPRRIAGSVISMSASQTLPTRPERTLHALAFRGYGDRRRRSVLSAGAPYDAIIIAQRPRSQNP